MLRKLYFTLENPLRPYQVIVVFLFNNAHFLEFSAREEYKEKRRFLYGESMGGAVALLTHKKDPTFWDGAVLVAPMCKVVHYVSICQ